MTVDEYIKFFEAIPEDKWCTGNFHKGEKSCALGHLRNAGLDDDFLHDILRSVMPFGANVVVINDGLSNSFRQHTPKKRILAALEEAKRENEAKN